MIFSTIFVSLNEMLSKLFELKTTAIENQSTLEVIEEKKDYKKATNITEKIISICEKYKKSMTFADRLKFSHLVEKFQKYN